MKHTLITGLLIFTMNQLVAQVQTGGFYFSFSGMQIPKSDSAFVHTIVTSKDMHHFTALYKEKYSGNWETKNYDYRKYGDSLIRCEAEQTDYYYRRVGESLYDVRIVRNRKLVTEGRAVSIVPLIKEGIWIVYHETTGMKVTEEVYMDNAYIGNQRYGRTGEKLLQSVFVNAQKMPEYQGDLKEMEDFVNTLITKSACYTENQQHGIIYGSFVVTELGEVTEIGLENSINACLDEIALYALKQLPSRWKPGMIEGKKVRILVTLPIRF